MITTTVPTAATANITKNIEILSPVFGVVVVSSVVFSVVVSAAFSVPFTLYIKLAVAWSTISIISVGSSPLTFIFNPSLRHLHKLVLIVYQQF